MAGLVRDEIEGLRVRLVALPSGRWPERRALEAMILRREVELHGLERGEE